MVVVVLKGVIIETIVKEVNGKILNNEMGKGRKDWIEFGLGIKISLC